MKILGINEGHNCSACILINGEVVGAVSEERFSRIKNDCGYPKKSIEFCLNQANISLEELDFVVLATKELNPNSIKMKRVPLFSIADYIKENHEYWKPVLYNKEKKDIYKIYKKHPLMKAEHNHPYDFSFLDSVTDEKQRIELFNKERIKNIMNSLGIEKSKIIFVDHHLCHAYYGYYSSELRKDSLILTVDGWGDGANASINIGENNSFKFIKKTTNNNLGRMYSWSTLLLGMKPNEHEYKVMGLAPYSKDYLKTKPLQVYSETLVVDGDDFKWNVKPTDMYFWFKEKLEGCRFDGIAGGLQEFTEKRMKEWIINILKKYPKKDLILTGGVALNVKANKKIMEIPQIKTFFVPAGSGDESVAIGGSYYIASKKCEKIKPIKDFYLGGKFSRKEILKEIKKSGIKKGFIVKERVKNKEIAKHLAEGKIIARFCGRMEFGARALGNRSILANPSNFETIGKINNQIKFRDFWMPFTPSILKEREHDYIINPKKIKAGFMTIAFDSTPLAQKELVATIHPQDKTIRPQIVEKEINEEYYNLIKEFENITGIGGLLNTSFNLHGKPIAYSPKDAIHTLLNSRLDMLLMEDILIIRK